MKTLTKAAEDKLIGTLGQVAELTNSGESPNEAIAKVASESRIPHGHIQLLVNAYNTGRSTAQRQSSDNVWDKSAEFPIAETDKILALMYPDNVKSAAEIQHDTSVAAEYSLFPGWVERFNAAHSKKADVNWKMVDKPAPLPREDNSFDKAKADIKRAEDAVKEARYRAAYAFDTAIRLKDEIKDYLKTAGAQTFDNVRTNVLALHGDQAEQLLDQIASEEPVLLKKANRQARLCPAVGPVYQLVADCIEATEAYRLLKDDFETKEAQLSSVKHQLLYPFRPERKWDEYKFIESPEELLNKSASGPAPSKKKDDNGPGAFQQGWSKYWGSKPERKPIDPDKIPGANKMMGYVPGMHSQWGYRLGQLIDKPPFLRGSPTNPAYQAAREDAYKQYLKDQVAGQYKPSPDGSIDQNYDMINQEALLSDLLSSDDVLSQRNPHDVLQAYSSLKQIAPRASSNRETLKALLRDRLERGGATSIFDLDTLVKVEKNLKSLEEKGPMRQSSDEDR